MGGIAFTIIGLIIQYSSTGNQQGIGSRPPQLLAL